MQSLIRTTPFFKAVLTILEKDIRAEMRSRQLIAAMSLFALLTTMVFYYTLESRPDVRRATLPAIVWVIVVFAGTLGLSRSLTQEKDRGSLDALLLAPIHRSALFYGKLISTWLFSLGVAVLVSFALSILFNVAIAPFTWLIVICLGTLGFATIGTFLGSMAIHARGRETTLPILILPIALPIIMAAVNASNAILNDLPFSDWALWLGTLFSVDTLFLVLAFLLFDFVVEE